MYTIIQCGNGEKRGLLKNNVLWNDIYYFGKNCLRGMYHELTTVLVACSLDGIMSRLAAKCRAETVEKNFYFVSSQSRDLEISSMFLFHFMIYKIWVI